MTFFFTVSLWLAVWSTHSSLGCCCSFFSTMMFWPINYPPFRYFSLVGWLVCLFLCSQKVIMKPKDDQLSYYLGRGLGSFARDSNICLKREKLYQKCTGFERHVFCLNPDLICRRQHLQFKHEPTQMVKPNC